MLIALNTPVDIYIAFIQPGNDCFLNNLHRTIMSTDCCSINREDGFCLLYHLIFKMPFCCVQITKVTGLQLYELQDLQCAFQSSNILTGDPVYTPVLYKIMSEPQT